MNDVSPPNRLRELRKARGLTLHQAAARAGCSHALVADLERGKVQLTHKWMRSFAGIYGVAPAEILAPEDQGETLSGAERAFIHLLRGVSPQKRVALAQLLDRMLGELRA